MMEQECVASYQGRQVHLEIALNNNTDKKAMSCLMFQNLVICSAVYFKYVSNSKYNPA